MEKGSKVVDEIYGSFSPDFHRTGLVEGRLDPLRYNSQSDDPREVPGILRALMPEHVRVLDVGCGTGSVTLVANRGKGNQVLAIEPDAQRSAIARARGIEVLCGFLDTPEPASAKIHTHDDENLSEACRVPIRR
jgi:SAM-dependent methyltransferase